MPHLRFFGLQFQNNIVIFEITVLEFVFSQSLVQKSLSSGIKTLHLKIFRLEFEIDIVMFEISTLQFA